MGTEEVLLIRHISCGYKQQQRSVVVSQVWPHTNFLLDDRCCASRPADITQRNPYSPSTLHMAAASCQFHHHNLHQPHAPHVTVPLFPLRYGLNLITGRRRAACL